MLEENNLHQGEARAEEFKSVDLATKIGIVQADPSGAESVSHEIGDSLISSA